MVYQYGLRLAARSKIWWSKSGGPSLGRSPGAHKQRRPVNQDQIQVCGEIGSTQFLEQGFVPCSFFFSAVLLTSRDLRRAVFARRWLSRGALARAQRAADGADALAGMNCFVIGDVAEQERVAIIEKSAVGSLSRGISVIDKFPIKSGVSALLRGNAIERHHLVTERNAKILQGKIVPGACRIGLFERILCVHAGRPRNVCHHAYHIAIDSYRYGDRH